MKKKLFFFDDIKYSVLGNKCFYSSCSRALRWHLVSEDQANCEHLYRPCETLDMVLLRALQLLPNMEVIVSTYSPSKGHRNSGFQ